MSLISLGAKNHYEIINTTNRVTSTIMDDFSADYDNSIMVDQRATTSYLPPASPVYSSGARQAIDNLTAEGGKSFYDYIDWIGLIKDPNLIVLSSVHHYYFDANDLKNTSTVVNLKQLNLISSIGMFLHTIYNVMPSKGNFIGCYLDNDKQHQFVNDNLLSQYQAKHKVDPFENGITSRIPFLNTIYNLMDSRTDRGLTRGDVSILLKKSGFRVLDMTELNGLTYFHAQKPNDQGSA